MANSDLDSYCGSAFWNYSRLWDTDDPDFTLCFEKTVFVWAPCVFLWSFSFVEFYFIFKSKNKDIPWNLLNITKQICTLILIAFNIADIANAQHRRNQGEEVPDVDVYTPVIKMVTFFFTSLLTFLNQRRGLRTSGVLTIFWIMAFVCGIPQYRSEIRRELYEIPYKGRHKYPFVSYMVYLPLVAVMLVLNCLADKACRNTRYPKTLRLCPEGSASFINKIYFSWFNRMAWTGSRRPLETSDLWTLREEDQNHEVFPAFYRHYGVELENEPDGNLNNGHTSKAREHAGKKKGRKKSIRPVSVLPALLKAFGGAFLVGSFFGLLQDILTFVSPFVLRLIIGYVQGNEPSWKGMLYAFTFLVTGVLQSVFSSQASYRSFVAGMRIRTALVGALFRKALRISSRSRKDSTVGSIVNLMSVDAHRFLELTQYLNSVWSAPLQIALALYFLYAYLGVAVFAGFVSLILLMPISGFIVNKEQSLQVQQLKCKDERLKFMNEILGGMKVLKLYAWEPSFQQKISDIRDVEVQFMKKEIYYHSATYFTWGIAPFVVTLFSFATFILIDKNNILDAETTFVCLALFNTLRTPLFMLPMTLAHVARAYVSIKRIDAFMNSEDLDPSSVSHDSDEEPALLIENGTFTWDAAEEPTLKDINLSLPQGGLVAVVGTVGSGKSSLVSAFLGEMEKVKGRVNVKGSVAYVQQQAWIQTATLKDNILFGTSYKSGPYDRVIDACALKTDLDILPGGDQTEIGEKGINLSGGQRQRVALARAVYRGADVYLMDDPLSAVDSHVGKHIFDHVIGPKGTLRGKTRLLVTHSVTFLPEVDLIVVLKDGEVSEIGTYRQLLERKGAFAEYLAQHTQGADEECEVMDDLGKSKDMPRRISHDSHHSDSASIEEAATPLRRKSDALRRRSSAPPQKDKPGQKLIQEELAETGNVKPEVYIHYLKSIGLMFVVGTILVNAINQVVYVGGSVWLSIWSTDPTMLNVNSTEFLPKRDRYLGVYAAIGVGQGLTTVVSGGVPRMGCVRAGIILHQHLLRAVMRAPLSFFDTTPTGRLLARFGRDMEVLDNVLPLNIPAVTWCLFEIIATLVVISYTTPEFLGVMVPIAVFYYFVQRFYVSTTRQLKRLESISRAHIYTHFSESITGAASIRAFRSVDRFVDESDKRVDVNQSSYFPSIVANHWLIVRLELVGNLVIFFAALFAVLQQGAPAGLLALSVTYSLQITSYLKWLVQMSSDVEANIVAVERIKEYSDTPPEADWETLVSVFPSWPDEGKIRFKNYETRYRPGLDLVLKGIDFKVTGGEKVGIVGRTGAGKSSLTLALFRVIEAAGGRIKIDGVDISNLGLHPLRSRLTIIPQDPVLFSGTLRHNIDPFQFFKDEEVWRALEHANLKAFVKGLGEGLSHQVTEGGENLSVGQRQLVCLARALLRKSKVLILDEATAAVDLDTDDFIQRKIREEFKDCTVLTIAHRLNTIMDSDRVMVLDQGRIAEFDSPAALLENNASIFYSMARDAGLA